MEESKEGRRAPGRRGGGASLQRPPAI